MLRQVMVPSKENSAFYIPAEFYGMEVEVLVLPSCNNNQSPENIHVCSLWLEKCIIQPIILSTIKLAHYIISKYDFQIFDGIIIAAALEAKCDILYSEDMQNGQIIENMLKIINPFI